MLAATEPMPNNHSRAEGSHKNRKSCPRIEVACSLTVSEPWRSEVSEAAL
jgi:hypothetical protein